MKIKIEIEFIKKIVELAFKFPLHEIYYDDYQHALVFHTNHAGGYTEWFEAEKAK